MTPRQDKLKLRSYSIYWPEGVASLISHENNLQFKSRSTYWPQGVAGLAPEEDEGEARILFNVFARGGGGFRLQGKTS